MGDNISCIPNKRGGGVCLGGKISPIFYNTMEDSGALPIELNVQAFEFSDASAERFAAGCSIKLLNH